MKKNYKIALLSIISIIALLLSAALCYVGYVALQYYRIEDNLILTNEGADTQQQLEKGKQYTMVTYNIGFGAYSPDYSFFMDTGIMADGTKTTGKFGRATGKKAVQDNTNGSVALLQKLNADFYLIQETDRKATRSYNENQVASLTSQFIQYEAYYAQNFHSAYLAYPFFDAHGKTDAGLLTLSRFKASESVRRSYPVDNSFPTRFFDLDRAFSVHRYPISGGGELVVINNHMSAYDKGGLIRAAQLSMLNETLKAENDKGNLVIVGGDFNHTLNGSLTAYPSKQQIPSWAFELFNEDIAQGFSIAKAENTGDIATCRGADMPYEKGTNYEADLDGFIVSDAIEIKVENIDGAFAYSDHNPVKLTFTIR